MKDIKTGAEITKKTIKAMKVGDSFEVRASDYPKAFAILQKGVLYKIESVSLDGEVHSGTPKTKAEKAKYSITRFTRNELRYE